MQTNIDNRKRAEALLAGERRLPEMVGVGRSLPVIPGALCRLAEEIACATYSSIHFVGPVGTHLEQTVASSLPARFVASIGGRSASVDSDPCAMAANLNAPVIAPGVGADPRSDAHGWRTQALAHGLQLRWATPILSAAQKAWGTFTIYRRKPGNPTALQQELIRQLAHIASLAIERAQSDAALWRSEVFLAETQHLSCTDSFSWRIARHS